jgi:hypothetical protein
MQSVRLFASRVSGGRLDVKERHTSSTSKVYTVGCAAANEMCQVRVIFDAARPPPTWRNSALVVAVSAVTSKQAVLLRMGRAMCGTVECGGSSRSSFAGETRSLVYSATQGVIFDGRAVGRVSPEQAAQGFVVVVVTSHEQGGTLFVSPTASTVPNGPRTANLLPSSLLDGGKFMIETSSLVKHLAFFGSTDDSFNSAAAGLLERYAFGVDGLKETPFFRAANFVSQAIFKNAGLAIGFPVPAVAAAPVFVASRPNGAVPFVVDARPSSNESTMTNGIATLLVSSPPGAAVEVDRPWRTSVLISRLWFWWLRDVSTKATTVLLDATCQYSTCENSALRISYDGARQMLMIGNRRQSTCGALACVPVPVGSMQSALTAIVSVVERRNKRVVAISILGPTGSTLARYESLEHAADGAPAPPQLVPSDFGNRRTGAKLRVEAHRAVSDIVLFAHHEATSEPTLRYYDEFERSVVSKNASAALLSRILRSELNATPATNRKPTTLRIGNIPLFAVEAVEAVAATASVRPVTRTTAPPRPGPSVPTSFYVAPTERPGHASVTRTTAPPRPGPSVPTSFYVAPTQRPGPQPSAPPLPPPVEVPGAAVWRRTAHDRRVFVVVIPGIEGLYTHESGLTWIRLAEKKPGTRIQRAATRRMRLVSANPDGTETYDFWVDATVKRVVLFVTDKGVTFDKSGSELGGGAVRRPGARMSTLSVAALPWLRHPRFAYLLREPLFYAAVPHVGGPIPKWNSVSALYYTTDGSFVHYFAYHTNDGVLRDYETGRAMSAATGA